MKIHKRTIIVLTTIGIILFIIIVGANYKLFVPLEEYLKNMFPHVFVGQRSFMLNLFMGILGSIIASLVIEIVNYNTSKKNCIIAFLQKAYEVNKLYSDATDAFKISNEESIIREMCKAILNYDITDLYNSFFDIDFMIKNKYSTLYKEVYAEIVALKYSLEPERKNVLFDNENVFKARDVLNLHRCFLKAQPLEDENGGQIIYHCDVIADKLETIQNYLFKTVCYRVDPPYDLFDSLGNSKFGWLFDKISFFLINIMIIKWSPTINKDCENYFYQKDFLKYKKIPFVKIKYYYNRPIEIKDVK